MNKHQKTVILSLGGSIVAQDEIQTKFLKDFRKFVLKFTEGGYRFVIIVGGGKICRRYQKAALEIAKISDEDRDWLGIQATRLNANLVRAIFGKLAYPLVLDNPEKSLPGKENYKIFIGCGWKPGASTDYTTVCWADKFKIKNVINISNVDYVYDKDPSKFADAQPKEIISWNDYLEIIGTEWAPGMNAPFDPIASQFARKNNMTVKFAKGGDFKNLESILTDKKFKGTIIS
jgi:uridylate kinase